MLLFTALRTYGAVLAAATTCLAGPLVVVDPTVVASPASELVARDHVMSAARAQYLEKRLSADFALDRKWSNEVLFGGNVVGEDGAESTDFQVTCIECWTKGVVTANLKNEDVINPVMRLDFNGVEAFVDLGVKAAGGATYAVNLFSSQDPSGLGIPGLSLGLMFHLDLVFSLSSDIDLTGGFYVNLADGSFLETEVFTGDVTDHLFDNLSAQPLDVVVKTGSATFKAALRVRVQAGAEADVDIAGVGAAAVVGIYANIVEFVAVLDSTPECPLQSREFFDLNVGAFARLGVAVDFTSIGAVPTVSTTLINSPTFTQCLQNESPAETGSADATPATSSTESTEPSDVAFLPPPDTTVAAEGEAEDSTPSDDVASPSGPAVKRSLSYDDTAAAKPTDESRPTSSNETYPETDASSSSSEKGINAAAVYSTAEYVVTRCAMPIINCPASLQEEMIVTRTYDANVKPDVTPVNHAFTDAVVLTACEEPVIETFAAAATYDSPAEETPYPEDESRNDGDENDGDEAYHLPGSRSKSRTRTHRHGHGHRHGHKPTSAVEEETSPSSGRRHGHKHRPTSTAYVTETGATKPKHRPTSKVTVPATAWTMTYAASVVTPHPAVPNLPDVDISVWMQTASMTSSLVMGNLGGGGVAAPAPAAPVVPAEPSSAGVADQIPARPVAVVASAGRVGVGGRGAALAAAVAALCGLMVAM